MYNPLKAETIEEISQAQTPARLPTLEERAGILRDLINRKCGNARMLANWRKDLERIQAEIETGEAMKVNATRTFGNVRLMTWEQIYEAAETGTLIPDGSDNSMSGSLKDAGFGDFGPM